MRFEVSNHRSIMEPIELSMIAVDQDRPATRGFELLSERVLTVAGIYGPNASGKSNVLEALAWLSVAVGTSLRGWDDLIPREPFKFGQGPASPSSYEVDLVVDGVRHTYQLVVDDSQVLFEGLYSYPERRRRTLFERDGLDLTFRRGLGGLAGTRDLLTPTTLALSAALRLREPEIRPVGQSLANFGLRGFRRAGLARALVLRQNTPTIRMFDDRMPAHQSSLLADSDAGPVGDRTMALAFLRFADLGIDDVQFKEVADDSQPDSVDYPRRSRRRVNLVHQVAGQRLPFDLEEESHGTRTWFYLIGPTVSALRTGQPLLFDEIDTSLHPRLSARLLELFQDPETNPHGAQLIFTSHDTSLLNHLNRDEVWLTEKGPGGSTTLRALAEYGGDKVRRSLNLERAYLQGRFGAVPELDQYVVHRALGLAPGGS